MCAECEKAVDEQAWGRLEEVASDEQTNRWLTRCILCGQLWDTYAYEPQFSWELSVDEAERKYPGSIRGEQRQACPNDGSLIPMVTTDTPGVRCFLCIHCDELFVFFADTDPVRFVS